MQREPVEGDGAQVLHAVTLQNHKAGLDWLGSGRSTCGFRHVQYSLLNCDLVSQLYFDRLNGFLNAETDEIIERFESCLA